VGDETPQSTDENEKSARGEDTTPKRKRRSGTPKPRKPRGGSARGGRPPAVPLEVKELARAHTLEAIGKLVNLMRRGKEQRVQLEAAKSLLDRGWGKPPIPISGPDGESPVVPELPELIAHLKRFVGG
jgi:hypothetical protein